MIASSNQNNGTISTPLHATLRESLLRWASALTHKQITQNLRQPVLFSSSGITLSNFFLIGRNSTPAEARTQSSLPQWNHRSQDLNW
jgi:hypothetical protein